MSPSPSKNANRDLGASSSSFTSPRVPRFPSSAAGGGGGSVFSPRAASPPETHTSPRRKGVVPESAGFSRDVLLARARASGEADAFAAARADLDARLAQEARVNEALQAQLGELRRESLFMSGALAALQARLNEQSAAAATAAAPVAAMAAALPVQADRHGGAAAAVASSPAPVQPSAQPQPPPTAPAVSAPSLPVVGSATPSSALLPLRATPLSASASHALSAIVRDSEAVARAIFEASTFDEARVAGARPLRLLESTAPTEGSTRSLAAPWSADEVFATTAAASVSASAPSSAREPAPRESAHDADTSFRSSPLRISSYAGALPLSARRAIYVRPLAPSAARSVAANAAQAVPATPALLHTESPAGACDQTTTPPGYHHAPPPSGGPPLAPLTPLTQAAAWHAAAAVVNAPLGVTAPTTLPLGAALALLPLLVPPSDASIDAALFGLRGGVRGGRASPAPTSANSALVQSLHAAGPAVAASGDGAHLTTRAMLASARAIAAAPR